MGEHEPPPSDIPVGPTSVPPTPPPLHLLQMGFSLPWPFKKRTPDREGMSQQQPPASLTGRPQAANAAAHATLVPPTPPPLHLVQMGFSLRWPFKKR
ncbi:MAG: hypothetical protein AB7L71_10750 [Vicinamibacterales bacterium]